MEREGGERKTGGGNREGVKIQHIDLMSIFSPCLGSEAERTMRTYTLRAPQGLILGRLSPKCLVTKN